MINIKRLDLQQKQTYKGGTFYAVALGVGILVSTVSSLVSNIICAVKSNGNTPASYGERRTGAMIRLSPVPTRSSICVL